MAFIDDLRMLSAARVSTYSTNDGDATVVLPCSRCVRATMTVLAQRLDVLWLICSGCEGAYLFEDGRLYPPVSTLGEPAGLPDDVRDAWRQARDCLSVGAYTAVAMLCRKILFHIAVDEGLPEKNDQGWAPRFEQCVKHLVEQGVITVRMRTWVDNVKDVGNEANHELTPIPEADAQRLAMFTLQLLDMHYGTKAALDAVEPPQGS